MKKNNYSLLNNKIKKIIFNLLGLILILPIFIYFNKDFDLDFSNCTIYECYTGISIGTIVLILFSLYFLSLNLQLILISLFITLFVIEFLSYNNNEWFLRAIKSLLPFYFLLTYLSIKTYVKISHQTVDKLLTLRIPYLIIFFQVIIILNNIQFENINSLFLPTEKEIVPSLFSIPVLKVYNYNQYFSFILAIACGVRLFLNIKINEKIFIIFFLIYSCLHAANFTALICSIIIIIFSFLNKKFPNDKIHDLNFRIFSYFFISMFFLIPVYSEFLLQFLNLENSKNFYQLVTRLERYSVFITNFNFTFFFNGIYPYPIFKQQMHNQFLEYLSFFGLIKTFFLMFILFIIFKRIKEIYFFFPLSVVIGLGGGLNEIFTHLYTGQIIFFYLVFSSNFKMKFN